MTTEPSADNLERARYIVTRSSLLALADRELLAAEALAEAGLMVSKPGEGSSDSDLYTSWGVCTGSHGGYGKRLKTAMKRCLKCCGIGEWWELDGGKMKDIFERVESKYLRARAGDRE